MEGPSSEDYGTDTGHNRRLHSRSRGKTGESGKEGSRTVVFRKGTIWDFAD